MNLIKILHDRFGIDLTEDDPLKNREPKTSQIMLSLCYKNLVSSRLSLPKISEVGFRNFSQTDEDGIILYIFSIIGTTTKTFVEIGAGNALESNCLNLAINFGWYGLFIDGDGNNAISANNFLKGNLDTRIYPPKFISTWVTKENINNILKDSGFTGEIDLLSIDIDGMDYWIWDAIHCITPRVVIIEANTVYGSRNITIPYKSKWKYNPKYPHYHGASLPALTKLARKKGYRLIGTNRYGYNAFFVRTNIGKKNIPSVSPKSCRTHKINEEDKFKFEKIRSLPFVKI